MKPMTAQQLTSICRVFTDGDNIAPTCQIQDLLDSGCLADLRDANFRRMDRLEFRNRIREVCGLPSVNDKGKVEHVIDFEASPFVHGGWKVESHQKTHPGTVVLTRVGDDLFLPAGRKMEFFLSPNQAEGKFVKGHKLRKEIEKLKEQAQLILDANVFDYLLAHPELIPDSWKVDEKGRNRLIFFWGTIYRDFDGNLYVRYLFWNDGRWNCLSHWLGSVWRANYPAAVLAA